MRAFVITGPGQAEVQDVEPPVAGPDQVVVDVNRVGVCGTDVELFTGDMQYLHTGHAKYPLRIGHEWTGTVSAVGRQVDPGWVGRRVTGDTMIGCRACRHCLGGNQHVCEKRLEVGIRGGLPGGLAEQMAVPVTSLHELPDTVDEVLGAFIEPGGSALRAVQGASLTHGDRALILGPGTIGLLAGLIAKARGAEVHLMGKTQHSLNFAKTMGFDGVWSEEELPELPFDAVIDASNAPTLPARALELVEPAKRVVYVGLAGSPSVIDTRTLAMKDVTAVGILSASPGLSRTIELFASGEVDPRPLVATTIGLGEVAAVLAGQRPATAGEGPKIHVDPKL